ncbi:EAL domain-containing protein [uncultured Thiodictyon sp.]|uniref:EAL domain-containing protein n=1 Tax=uncultured Thiodictyon sp. TaxID=1846217 RepID=UPI0025E72A46|nr:EAL domain-containing protein [uncultured Thiodictyon sp.]
MNAHNPPESRRGTVLFLGTDAALSEALASHLSVYGLTLETVQSPADLRRRVQPPVATPSAPSPCDPGAVVALIDLRAFPNRDAMAGLGLGGTTGQGPRLPLVCLGPASDLPQRVAAIRAGAVAWLAADLDAQDLAARLAAVVGPADGTPERVLVVDDQPVSALFAARILECAGMATEQVTDPLLVLSVMDRFAPDLVLMDLHMPGVSGIELTAVIREQERFADLPIIFLSVELDPERQLEALRVGGDDFLAKPVQPGRLVFCVRRRLAAARMRSQGAAVTVNREHLLARLDRLLHSPAAADWVLIYLERPGQDAPTQARLAAAVAARAGADALTVGVGEHGVGVLMRGGPERCYAAVAQALGQGVRADLGTDGAEVPTFGVGWCALPAGGGESVTLVSRARKAACLSLERHQGRADGYIVAPPARPGDDTTADPTLAAIKANRLQLLFQPMVTLGTAAAERYEATPRLAGPHGELLAPRLFVPLVRLAETARLIDRWLLTAGLDALRERHAAGRPLDLFLHQSIVSAADDTWIQRVRDEISARDLIQCRPTIQWELADMENHLDLAVQRAEQLAHLRLRLCLNGFTDGDIGQRVLERLPVAYVRLTREWIREASPDRLQDLVRRVHGHHALVIATGVEGPEAITPLYCAGVDLIQGPYVQPPTETMDFDFAEAVG